MPHRARSLTIERSPFEIRLRAARSANRIRNEAVCSELEEIKPCPRCTMVRATLSSDTGARTSGVGSGLPSRHGNLVILTLNVNGSPSSETAIPSEGYPLRKDTRGSRSDAPT